MLRTIEAVPREEVDAAPAADAKTIAAQAELDERARAALRDDPAALRAFLGAVAPIIRRVCRGVIGRESSELEDAIQDCLIDVARALPQFRFESSVSHYVTKIAMRRAIACRQRASARLKQHATLDSSSLPGARFDPALEVRASLVRDLLDELNEDQAKALLLRIMLGHSIEEIASITGVSANTVKTRLRLAKGQLRRWLQRSAGTRHAGG